MQRVILLLILLAAACTRQRASLTRVAPSFPYDPSLGEITVVVPEVNFIAGVDSLLYRELCPGGLCGGAVWLPQNPSGELFRHLPQTIHFGEKRFPGLWPGELRMVLVSALHGLKNVRIIEGAESLAKSTPSRARTFRIEVVITEVSFNSEENMVGTGTSIFSSVGGVLGNVEGGIPAVINTQGYVRADVSVINLATGEILMAFPATGHDRKEFSTSGTFDYRYFIPQGFARSIIQASFRNACHDAVYKLTERFGQLHGKY